MTQLQTIMVNALLILQELQTSSSSCSWRGRFSSTILSSRFSDLAAQKDYKSIETLLIEPRVEGALDVNTLELATDPATVQSGGTLLHEAARQKDIQLAQLLLMHGADPFRRDKRGKLPQDVTKDERTRGHSQEITSSSYSPTRHTRESHTR